MDEPTRPEADADATEIAKWMEEDFEWALSEGITNALEESEEKPRD